MYSKMSTFPKLKIDISDLSRKKMNFIDIDPEPPPKPTKYNVKYIYVGAVLIFIVVCISFTMVPKNLTPRRIIRLNCFIAQNTQTCSSNFAHGEFVVGNCDAYEFNGIPFVELTKVNGNYRIPMSSDLTLRIREPCPKIIAIVDTQRVTPYYTEYAKSGMLYTKRLIWITSSCYTSFTLMIGNQRIFDSTPVQMIDSVSMNNLTAFKYESGGVSGTIQVSGKGCDYPIQVYSI